MADAAIMTCADAVAGFLNARFAGQFEATVQVEPQFDLQDLADVRVSVVPMGRPSQVESRVKNRVDLQVNVAVVKKWDGTPAGLRADVLLMENIEKAFLLDAAGGPQRFRVPGVGTCIGSVNEPIYDAESLRNERLFRSLLKLTVRGFYP